MKTKLKVFLIDDDRFILKIVTKLFDNYEIDVSCFSCPEAALSAMEKVTPDLVFLDYNMPDMNGDEVIIKVSEKKLFNNTNLYLLTGSSFTQEDVIKFKTLGFYDVIEKPMKISKLEEIFNFHFGNIPHKQAKSA
jgi:DNA-binding response OmpR family regulator